MSVQAAQCSQSSYQYQGGVLPDVYQNLCINRIGETFASISTDSERREYLQSVGCPASIATR
jgi:hypothetical protein